MQQVLLAGVPGNSATVAFRVISASSVDLITNGKKKYALKQLKDAASLVVCCSVWWVI